MAKCAIIGLMDIFEIMKVFIISVVEGITEWLPVSSTGHMILVDEFVKGDANTYVVRKTQYKLQQLFLVATYEDKENQEWHMLMPSELTKALTTSLNFYLDMANKGVKAPSAKQLRMMSALGQFLGSKEL